MEENTESKEGVKPVHAVRSGMVQGSIWKNTREVNGNQVEFFNCQITKRYKKADSDDWASTDNYSKNDLHNLMTVSQKLFEFLNFKVQEQKEKEQE